VCYPVIALVLIAFAPAAASDVTATRLDGTAITGELRTWDEGQIVLSSADSGDGEASLATEELLSLAWKPAPPRHRANASSSSSQVELSDGSLLPIEDFTSSATTATVTLAAPLPPDEKTVTLSRTQLRAVRLQPLAAAAGEQWQEIRALNPASDVLVLLKRGGKSLDYVEGVLGEVSADKIEFKLDGDPLRIDRDKVAGLVYYRLRTRAEDEPRCVVKGRSGLRANASRATLTDGLLKLETTGGATLDWPLDDIYLADFSAGKLLYLSDVEPASERWTPLVGLPPNATMAAEYGRPRYNQSAYGGPLTLRLGDEPSFSPIGLTRTFNKGLAVRSRAELVYRLPDGFRRFTTIAGIDPSTAASGNVRLEIYGDDRLLFDREIAGHQPPLPIELDIAGVKRLKILVDYGRNLDTGDWLNLCDARIVK
jgi:hypothetical protein